MEEVFIAIMEQIAQEMPELSLIDEDYGQLEMGAEEDQYPVTFPCVLIGNTSSDWNDLGYGVQKSESMLTVRLAIHMVKKKLLLTKKIWDYVNIYFLLDNY